MLRFRAEIPYSSIFVHISLTLILPNILLMKTLLDNRYRTKMILYHLFASIRTISVFDTPSKAHVHRIRTKHLCKYRFY